MRIVQLSTYDINGGAARGTYRLHKGLRDIGIDARMFVQFKWSEDPFVEQYIPTMEMMTRIHRRYRRALLTHEIRKYKRSRPKGLEMFSDVRTCYEDVVTKVIGDVDLVHLNWVSGFVDLPSLIEKLPTSIPIVLTLHDMGSFTGGCHYDMGCEKYLSVCGCCPQLGSNDNTDLSNKIFLEKEKLYGKLPTARMRVIAPSRWIATEAKRSTLIRKFNVDTIPYSVDTNIFQPRDKILCRQVLGIPEVTKVVLFVSDSIETRRKGLESLVIALRGVIKQHNFLLVTVGHGRPGIDESIPCIHLGRIDRDGVLSLAYNAADIFVAPAHQEVFGLTVLEALACGVPVIAHNIGGIPDMVRSGETGLLAENYQPDSLCMCIETLLDNDELRQEMSRNCRKIAENEYNISLQANRYATVYEELFEQWSKKGNTGY